MITWKAPYGYRRIPRGQDGPAHLEIFEPEAAVARRIFAERAAGTTIRQICRQLNADAVPTPTGSCAVWGTCTLDRMLRNEAYIGRTYFNRTETVPDRRPGHHSRQVPRPRADWIAIPCPAVIADETFQAAGKASTDNALTSTRPTWSTCPNCSVAPLRSPPGSANSRTSAPALPPSAPTSPAETGSARPSCRLRLWIARRGLPVLQGG